ncbi:MAG: branched-chain amino acid ABC transporter permease [Proteobacteria bacterium]|nr:branched-chain amino acid ABC transporter permease [Pseudomonadota bacterium]
MDIQIASILAVDGIATGAIYVLIALGTVLIFSVTRVMFVPFGDLAAYSALTLAMLQTGQLPGTVMLVSVLAGIALLMELTSHLRAGKAAKIPKAILYYGILPVLPPLIAWLSQGTVLPFWAQMLLALALVLPIAPLLDRIAFRPLADASVLVLLIVAVAVHFAISGLALLFFGPEGYRTEPISRAIFDVGGVIVSAQTLLVVLAAAAFSGLLYLYFERTISGKALKATSSNRLGARLVGIRPQVTGTIAYLLGGLLGGVSGLLIGPVATLYYDSGFLIGLKAFVGAVVGGLASYPLTALGAIAVGLLESFASFWSSQIKETIVFSALIPILIWRSLAAPQHEEEEEDIA